MKKLFNHDRKEALKSFLNITSGESEYYTFGNRKFKSFPNFKKIDNFIATHNLTDKYPASDLNRWHKIMTSSCNKGREEFMDEHHFSMSDDEFTVPEFFEYAKQYWGGEIIEIVEERMREMQENNKGEN